MRGIAGGTLEAQQHNLTAKHTPQPFELACMSMASGAATKLRSLALKRVSPPHKLFPKTYRQKLAKGKLQQPAAEAI
jgi:hypothetical protein